jgi:CRISPR type I-D-associated protein Csc1
MPSIRLFRITLYPHDPLWFSSVEFGGQVFTEPIIHPYALTFALGNTGRVSGRPNGPNYEEDLPSNLYCLAAEGVGLERIRLSYNAVDEVTNRTDTRMDLNTPRVGSRLYIRPSWEVGYHAFLFTQDGSVPRRVVRLGKKGAAVRVDWEEIPGFTPRLVSQPAEATHLVSPLDIQGELRSFVPVRMSPHLMVRHATITNDWFVFSGEHRIHIPRRVMQWQN